MKKIFLLIINLISKVFNKMSPEIKRALDIASRAVEGLKTKADSPVIDIITAIIPGKTDDIIVAQARVILPQILLALGIVKDKVETADEVVNKAIERLKDLPDDLRDGYLHLIAVLLSKQTTDLSFGEAALAVESYYRKYVKK